MNHETNESMGNLSKEELEEMKARARAPEKDPTKGMSPKEMEEQAKTAAGGFVEAQVEGMMGDSLTEEQMERMTAPEEATEGGPSPTDDKQEPKLGDVVERVEVSVDDLPVDIPAPEPLPVAEQLAHTQVAYQGLLEDFEKVSRELAEVKEEVKDRTRVNSGVRGILEVPEGESVLLVATALKRELTDLKEVPGDAIQVASLQGQVEDLQDEKLTLDEAVRLKQQVIDKLETRVTDLQVKQGNLTDAYEDLRSKTLREVPIQELPADLKSLLKQVADLQEANRILRLRLQS